MVHGFDVVTNNVDDFKNLDLEVFTVEQLEPIFEAMDLVLSEEVLAECDRVHEGILYPMG